MLLLSPGVEFSDIPVQDAGENLMSLRERNPGTPPMGFDARVRAQGTSVPAWENVRESEGE